MLSYLTVDTVILIGPAYYYSLVIDKQNMLLEVFDEQNAPKIKYRAKDQKHLGKAWYVRLERFVYKVVRGFYVSVIYYFTPYLFLLLNLFFIMNL